VIMSNELSFLEIVQQHLESNDTCLPPFNATAQRIQREIMKEDPDVQLIEQLIVRDQAITGQVLRVANSSFYKGLVKATTVHNAVLRLGINEVSNMVTLVTQEKNFRSKDPLINGIMRALWRHSVGCAVGAHWLAKKSGYLSLAHEVFFAGLLHDIGKLFILAVVENIRRNKTNQQPSNALLDEVTRSMHSDYGFALLNNWNLPSRYCDVARDHHKEDFDPKDFLLLIVRMANHGCNKVGIGADADPSLVLSALPEAKVLGLSDVDLAQFEIQLEDLPLC
jgi:HD-like signal output (HDOD) protein